MQEVRYSDVYQSINTEFATYHIYSLRALEEQGMATISTLPFSIKILLEFLLRNIGSFGVSERDIPQLVNGAHRSSPIEIPFMPSRVVMQDASGVPALVDLTSLRRTLADKGLDYSHINPVVPVDLVIDHSVQVEHYGTKDAMSSNLQSEYRSNKERYEFLKWAQSSFKNFRVVPPSNGIIHQVNLEYLAQGVQQETRGTDIVVYPDTVIGTDSHTTMINALGVLGWGVGGIEAEAVMLGNPITMVIPEVVGVYLIGEMGESVSATDVALTVTQILRGKNVVGKFVEFYGPGLEKLSLPDRATIANMAPEYGATMGFFPVDHETLSYMHLTGRDEELIRLVEVYSKEQGLYYSPDSSNPSYSDIVQIDLSAIKISVAGPARPQDRLSLDQVQSSFQRMKQQDHKFPITVSNESFELADGSIVIAAITSCTNTSNPYNMIAVGLVAKKAVELGLRVPPYIQTSFAPGSKVVSRYLEQAGLTPYLEALGFYQVGYGCMVCVGNSGRLHEKIEQLMNESQVVLTSVLSGNRNFEGRIHSGVKANYLAAPPLVVAYALAGTIDINLATDPIAINSTGEPIYLSDIWPKREDIHHIEKLISTNIFRDEYDTIFEGDASWKALVPGEGQLYEWKENSTYFKNSPFFGGAEYTATVENRTLKNARVLLMLGDSVTTDHISPVGAIRVESVAGQYLMEQGVQPADFNSYGSRRGNHEVLVRGTFAHPRLSNQLVENNGAFTTYLPTGETLSVYEASVRYQQNHIPLIILAGNEYGTGSARDWASKGTYLLGVKAVIARSFERIHRSNLAMMGILPLQLLEGITYKTLGLTGEEHFTVQGLDQSLQPGQLLNVIAVKEGAEPIEFTVKLRLDTMLEIDYYRSGGMFKKVTLQYST